MWRWACRGLQGEAEWGIHGGGGVGAKDALHEYGGKEELEEGLK